MTKATRKFCPNCKAHKRFEKEGINHVLHLLLSIVTFGVWSVVWILLGLISIAKPYRCAECGYAARL